MPGALLHCPIRGALTIPERAANGLTFTEEKRRIDCIRYLLAKGYPPTHFKIETVLLRFGHKGKNSFRTDLVVLDVPASSVPSDEETVRQHARLIAEFKRDNADASVAKHTQVQPALDFLHNLAALGIYWDDVEQRLFYRTIIDGTRTKTNETTVAVLPAWGHAFETVRLKYGDLKVSTSLLDLFKKIEDRLHTEVSDKSTRFEIMLQLLLAKLHDEHTSQPSGETAIQDFSDSPLGDADVKVVFEKLLAKATRFYRKYLPRPVPDKLELSGAMLRDASSLLAPVRILGSKRAVVQDFYMYFAKAVYKWDLAQYFTPTEVVDFIVTLANPRGGDQVKDPACGTGDFLISSFHYAQRKGADIRDAVWGSDDSANAVQMCVLNMVLNGDGKGNIRKEDSLVRVDESLDHYTIMLCNPPFGVRIQEKRFDVLKRFDLGHQWARSDKGLDKTNVVLKAQEVGILFAELCVKQAEAGGRIGIILPNGYLGNRSARYLALREWLIRHTRLIAVVGFPRFTFKKSGADVSASVLIMEKRETPLQAAADSEGYPFYAGLVETVGWNVANKQAVRIYKRDPESGAYLTDAATNEPVPDADFDRVLRDVWSSDVPSVFPWMTQGIATVPRDGGVRGWSLDFRVVAERADLSIDPKRWCERAVRVREQIAALDHFALGDVVDVIPEQGAPNDARALYRYVELQDTADGIVTPTSRRGWELPERARHRAQQGDIFTARIWSSMGKWFLAGGDCSDLLVSNGFLRLRLKPGKEEYLPDILVGVNTEAYRIQGRALSTGSDGLAELSDADLREIVLPRVTDAAARAAMTKIADDLLHGRTTVASVVKEMLQSGQVQTASIEPRSTNWVQV
jgi:type I restriction enzyme M protein